jgi:hypothetical protein
MQWRFFLWQLRVATVGTYNLKRFRGMFSTVVCGIFICRAVCLVDLRGIRAKTSRHSSVWTSVTVVAFRVTFVYKWSQVDKTVHGTRKSTILLVVSIQTPCECASHSNCSPRLLRPQHAVSLYLRLSFTCFSEAHQVEKFRKWSVTNCQHDHITDWNGFSFHSCALQFMINITVKWRMFHT